MPARVFYSENLICFDAEQQIRKLVSVDIVRRDQSVTRSSSEAAPAFEPPSLVAVLGQRRLQRVSVLCLSPPPPSLPPSDPLFSLLLLLHMSLNTDQETAALLLHPSPGQTRPLITQLKVCRHPQHITFVLNISEEKCVRWLDLF